MKKLLLALLLAFQTTLVLAQEPPVLDAPNSSEPQVIIVDPTELQAQAVLQHITNEAIVSMACGIIASKAGDKERAGTWFLVPGIHGAEHGLDPSDPDTEQFFGLILEAAMEAIATGGIAPEMEAMCNESYPTIKKYVDDFLDTQNLIEPEGDPV